jgi:hypothetical protein
MSESYSEVSFKSGRENCFAWLYQPGVPRQPQLDIIT